MDATPNSARPRGRWWRRALRRVGLAAGLLLAALLGLYLTRDVFLAPFLAERAAQELTRRSGAQVTIGSLGGDWWGALELRDVSWVDDSPRASLSRAELGWARVEYDLPALLRGELSGLSSVSASRVRLEVRQVEASDPAQSLPRDADATPGWSIPARLPRVSLRDLSARLQLGAERLELAEVDLDLEAWDGEGHTGNLRMRRAGVRLADGRGGAAPLECELRWSAPRLSVSSLRLDAVERLREAWVDLGLVALGDLDWAGQLVLLGGEIDHSGRLARERLELQLEFRGVQLAEGFDALWPGRDLPRAVLDGSAALALDLERPAELEASYAGKLSDLQWLGRTLDSAAGRARYAAGVLEVPDLLAQVGDDRVRVSDLTLPLGLEGLEMLSAARGGLQVDVTDVPTLLRGEAAVDAFGRVVPQHELSLALRLEQDQLAFEGGALTTADGSFRVRPGFLRWGRGSLQDTWIDLDLDFDFRELSSLGAILATPRVWSGSLGGELSLEGSLDRLVGHLELDGTQVIAANLPLGELRATADIDQREARVREFSSNGDLGRIEGSGVWELGPQRLRDARLSSANLVLGLLVPELLDAGTLDFEGQLSGTLIDPRGEFALEARGLSWLANEALAVESLSARGQLQERRLVLEHFVASLDEVLLELRGDVEHRDFGLPLVARLDEFKATREELDLVLQAPARIELDSERIATGDLHLRGSAGDLRATFLREGDDLKGSLQVHELSPMSLLAPLVPAGFELSGLACDLDFERSSEGLRVAGGVTAERLRPAAGLPELSVQARGSLREGRAELLEFTLDAGEGRHLELTGSAPVEIGAAQPLVAGAVDLRGRLELGSLQELPWERLGLSLPLAGDLGLDLELGGDWEALSGKVELRGESLAIVSPRSGAELFGPARLSGRLEFEPRQIRAQGIEFRSPEQAAISLDGSLAAGLRPAQWLRAGTDEFLDAGLDARLQLAAAELAVLARMLPSVRRVGGGLSGNVDFSGSLREPELSGEVELQDGELRLVGDLPGIADLNARLSMTTDGVEIVHLSGEIGGGPLECHGQIRWGGEQPEFDLTLTGEEVLLVQLPSMRVRADLELGVKGPLGALLVQGSLDLREGRYTKNIDFYAPDAQVRAPPPTELSLFSFRDAPLADMRFDIAVRSSEPFVVRNNLVAGQLRCDLRLGGSGHTPELVGSLFVETARVRLPASSLESRSGTIRFERDDPLVPRLDVRLTTRAQSYDVVVHLQGTSLEPEVVLSSSPPLSEEALLLLILTGKPPKTQWNDSQSSAAVENVAVFIGKDILQGWVGGGDDGESLLDRIEWRSGVDVSKSGADTSEFSVRLTGPASGPGRTLLLRAEEDIYDRTNFGLRLILRRK